MTFNISATTHKGTIQKINQDVILVNQNVLFEDGKIHFVNQQSCSCFVADGMWL
jgi:serine/threonine protein phosphatase PrpC